MSVISATAKNNDFRIIIASVLYVLFAQIGIWLTFPESKLAAFWPPAGLSFALIILMGYKIWPAIPIGSLLAGLLVFIHQEIALTFESISTLLIVAVANTIEALLGYFLIIRLIKKKNPFDTTANVFIFILIAMLASVAGSATSTFGFMINLLPAADTNYLNLFLNQWSACVVSLMIVTPSILAWQDKFIITINKKTALETVIFFVCIAGVISTTYYEPIAETMIMAMPFLVMPFLLWVAFRANLQITVLSTLMISLFAIYITINNLGPFVLQTEESSLLIVQIFVSIIAVSAIILNSTVRERNVAEKALKSFNETLEKSVKKRTKELEEEIIIRKSTEEKMKLANRKLRKTNAELDNFVYSVSHDLRAPIASVLGLVHLAKKEKSVKQMRSYIEMVGKSAEQQDKFIRDILDLSRNSRLHVANEEIKFDGMINEVFDQLKFYDTSKTVVKEVKIDQNNQFISDKKRLKVILNNLISNSIRYSKNDPKIEIGIKVDDALAKIQIKDNGKGIAKKHLKKVFNMFYRATDDNAGSGLGLYIVKETVDKLRGNISLESNRDGGTVVNLEIPNLNHIQN